MLRITAPLVLCTIGEEKFLVEGSSGRGDGRVTIPPSSDEKGPKEGLAEKSTS